MPGIEIPVPWKVESLLYGAMVVLRPPLRTPPAKE
jgi:hypothetical protein